MTSKPELLAPAGDFDALIAAVQNGADAVYLGGKSLNARRGAGNFDRDQLKSAADYLHERGKKLYVTVNTMVKQAELPLLHDVADDIAYAGADAVIVQDFGVCEILAHIIPGIRLHASTQMAVHNRQGAEKLRSLGFERVVLAREMSYNEIAACAAAGIETEVFCHGALCVACSGQCLYSSLVGGRSGNRGACAQPCRLPYTLSGAANTKGYLLSPRDLMTAQELGSLVSTGVTSLKIEGRLKRPEYVAVVTSVYRRLLDGEPFTEKDAEELRQIFNRGGFTPGYSPGIRDGEFISKQRPSHWGVNVGTADTSKIIRLEKDVLLQDALVIRGNEETPVKLEGFAGRTLKNPTGKTGEIYRLVSEAQTSRARESCTGEHVPVPVSARLTLVKGKPARAEISDGTRTAAAEGDTVAQSQKSLPDPDRVRAQFCKTGGTCYSVTGLQLDMDSDAFVPVSVINALRRDCIAKLSEARIADARSIPAKAAEIPCLPKAAAAAAQPRIAAQSADINLLRSLGGSADDLIYFPADLRRLPDIGGMFLYLPPVAGSETLERLHEAALRQDIRGVYITNFGQTLYTWPGEVRFSFELNIANEFARSFLGVGERIYTPSAELTAREMSATGGNRELIVYGRLPLMHLRHCPLNAARSGGKHTQCRACDNAPAGKRLDDCVFTDRMNARFMLRRIASDEGCAADILNCVPMDLSSRADRLPEAAAWRLIFTDEDPRTAARIASCFRSISEGHRADTGITEYTTGHYFRGVE